MIRVETEGELPFRRAPDFFEQLHINYHSCPISISFQIYNI